MPDSNYQRSLDAEVLKTVRTMRDAKAVALSDTGPNEAQSGPERWTTCARIEFSTQTSYYTFFVRGGDPNKLLIFFEGGGGTNGELGSAIGRL